MFRQKNSEPKYKRTQRISTAFAVVMLFALVLTACASPTPSPAPAATEAPTTAAPATTAPTAVPPTSAPTVEPTPIGPVAVLPTPAPGTPSATAAVNTWILAGPGTAYPVYGAMLGGVQAQIVGVSENQDYWVVSVPVAPQGQGWVPAASIQAANASSSDKRCKCSA